MPFKSLLADDDDDDSLEHSIPSDVDTAITYLLTTFPHHPPHPHYLDPPIVLTAQLYALLPGDRTAVDREVDRRRRAGQVRVMRCVALGVDEYALMRVEEYVAVVRSMWAMAGVGGGDGGGGDKVAAGEERKEESGAAGTAPTLPSSSLLAPTTQPIRRKRPRTETNPSPARPPLSPSARQPIAPSPPRLAADSASSTPTLVPTAAAFVARTASSSSATASPDDDKENVLSAVVVPKAPSTAPRRAPTAAATAPASSPSPRAADQQLLLDTLINTFLPSYTDVTITRGELLALLYDGLPYQHLTADDVLSTLFHHQLLAHNTHHPTTHPSSSSLASTSYQLLLPHTAHLVRECLDARQYVVRLIERSRYKQLRKSELEGRVRLPVTERGVVWHVLEMVGSGRLLEVETTKGTVVRVNSEYRERR